MCLHVSSYFCIQAPASVFLNKVDEPIKLTMGRNCIPTVCSSPC